MLKKIFIGALFVGLIGVLVWGGVNRTLAKADDQSEGSMGRNSLEYNADETGVGVGRRGQDNLTVESAENEIVGRGHHGEGEEDCDNEPATDAGNEQHGYNESMDEEAQGYRGGSVKLSPEADNQDARGRGRGGNGVGMGASQEPLDEAEIEALHMALDDEYHALATYLSVMETFGDVEPFANIAQAEQSHIDALVNQFNKYAIPVPENPWIGNVPTFASLTQACQTGVDAEIANAALYDKLFSMTDNAALIRVFTNLRNASLEHHLPEFEACN